MSNKKKEIDKNILDQEQIEENTKNKIKEQNKKTDGILNFKFLLL